MSYSRRREVQTQNLLIQGLTVYHLTTMLNMYDIIVRTRVDIINRHIFHLPDAVSQEHSYATSNFVDDLVTN